MDSQFQKQELPLSFMEQNGVCVHSILCLQLAGLSGSGVPESKRVFANRKRRARGRPAKVEPAVLLEGSEVKNCLS